MSTATGAAGRDHEHGPILVTGGYGHARRFVVPRLRDTGGTVRVLSRRGREAGEGVEFVTGDLATGEGIKAALEGAETIALRGQQQGDAVNGLGRGWRPLVCSRVPASFLRRTP